MTNETKLDAETAIAIVAAIENVDPADCDATERQSGGFDVRCDDREYSVCTDDQATAEAAAEVADSLWAFRSEFLRNYVPALHNYVPALRDDRACAAFDQMREVLCEDANELVRALVGDRFAELMSDAIAADGRGHFLASYDGAEREVNHDGQTFYVYRRN